MLDVQIEGKRVEFFDEKLTKSYERNERKALSKCGAFVRQAALGKLKYGKKSSRPGNPPMVHRVKGGHSPLKKLLFFAFDGSNNSVVVGPMQYQKSRGRSNMAVPTVLEIGGTSGGVRRAPRPFMRPALFEEINKFPDMFKNILGG